MKYSLKKYVINFDQKRKSLGLCNANANGSGIFVENSRRDLCWMIPTI